MNGSNEYIMERVYSDKVTKQEINELFNYLIGRDRWKEYLQYEKKERGEKKSG